MYRLGHTGIVLLALAPLTYVLLDAGRPLLAVLAFGVLVIEPLPDSDYRLPGFEHRGVSHSLLSVGVVGLSCALVGWLCATFVTVPLARWLSNEVLPTADIDGLALLVERLASLNPTLLAEVGLLVGSGGICLHLLGDIITISGIRPFLPLSRWRISLSRLRAKNRLVNAVLFVCGLFALSAVLVVTTPLGEWMQIAVDVVGGS